MLDLKHDDAERELMETETATLQRTAASGPSSGCPSDAELRRFAAGREGRAEAREDILTHLAACSRCVLFLAEIRRQKVARTGIRQVHIKKAALAFVAAAIVAVTAWIWHRKSHETNFPNQLAVVDLRLVSPTRGPRSVSTADVTKVERHASQLRLILPVGSAEGAYEAGVFRDLEQRAPLLRDSGYTSVEEHNVILVLKFNFSTLKPGRYWLGLHQDNSEWASFPLSVQ